MKVSKYSKTYDTANGSEQHFDDEKSAELKGAGPDLRSGTGRWQDDGGPGMAPLAASAPTPDKPSWSILSLRAMKAAVAAWLAGAPVREQQETARAEAAERRAVTAANDEAQTVHRDRHRNAWENT